MEEETQKKLAEKEHWPATSMDEKKIQSATGLCKREERRTKEKNRKLERKI